MLEVKNLKKSFGGLYAVCDLSFSIKSERITGLIGPNGAGKTTIFNLITGFLKPDSGEIIFEGKRIDGLPPHQIFRKGICRTFQIPREFKNMTVLENLMVVPSSQLGERLWNSWLKIKEVRRQELLIREKAIEVLKFLELEGLKDEYAKNLSGGQKKLLELGRVLMADPKLILLDEPGAGVNRVLLKQLAETIKRLCFEKGITFLIIEHDMDLITYLCNPVIVITEGKRLAEGTPEEIKKDRRVLEAYLGGQYR